MTIMHFISPIRYQIMVQCWQLKNTDRPTFAVLAKQLKQHHSDVVKLDMSISSSPY